MLVKPLPAVGPVRATATASRKIRVTRMQMVSFTRQFATLIQANVAIIESLDCLARGAETESFRDMLIEIGNGIGSGQKLSRMLGQFPQVFPSVYVSLVKVGENTGSLATTLESLAVWQEKDQDTFHKVKSALTYPAFVILTTCGLALFFVYALLPQLLGMLSNHKDLPLITRALVGTTNVIASPVFWIALLALVGEAFLIYRRIKHRPESRKTLYDGAMATPMIGSVLRDMAALRFCVSMEVMLGSGMTLVPALKLAGRATGNPVVEEALGEVVKEISAGEPLWEALTRHKTLFPSCFRHLLRAGEESGQIQRSFTCLQRHFEEALELRLHTLDAALGPTILAGAALLVAVIVMAIFLPLYGSLDNL